MAVFYCPIISIHMKEKVVRGSKEEVKLFTEVDGHYSMAQEDLDQRVYRKNGFNDSDRFFSSYIDEKSWPYRSLMFDPRPYTVILEKSARLIGSKPKGRLVPREGGDAVGAKINNELLQYQWDDNGRLGETMISKWIQMDQNARKYGASFAICKWRYEKRVGGSKGKVKTFYDGPDFVVCNPRDVLANPSYSFVNKWFQHREYVTLEELEKTNDVAGTGPVYRNLDLLRDSVKEQSSGNLQSNSRVALNENKNIRGLSDFTGRDEVYKTVEIVTEYRPDRWITFAPRHGIILRDIPNPYKHGEIPVVMLRYYPLGDDLYGMSEYEPVSKLIRGINSLVSQHIDTIAVDLYPPLMINPVNVRMNTIEFTPEAKWLMNNPGVDVKRFETSPANSGKFREVYSLLVSSLMNAWGETSQGISGIDPFAPDKTATEVRDSSMMRNVRDNMNMIYLSDALKKQIMLWHSMNQQFFFSGTTVNAKVIRVVGRDVVEDFMKMGLGDISPTEEEANNMAMGKGDMVVEGPRFPVDLEGVPVPKFQKDEFGMEGKLLIEPGDLMGDYDYIPDIESMRQPSDQDVENKLTAVISTISSPAIMQMLASEGTKPKIKELLVKLFESTKVIQDADAFFEESADVNNQMMQDGTNTAGVPNVEPSPESAGNGVLTGMAGGNAPIPPVQNQQLMG